MSKHSISWHAVVESERLERPSRRRWTTVLTLGTIATVYYFAIPAMLAWAPARLRLHVTEGTILTVSHCPPGAVIAWTFLCCSAALDC
jgi:hypothetical protein